jgi:hypothetical protein
MAAGAVAVYAGLRRALRRASERQEQLEREVHALGAAMALLEARLAGLHRLAAAPAAPAGPAAHITLESMAAAADFDPEAPKLDGVEPEMVRVLAAAAAAALGRNVRLLSARLMPPPVDTVNPWSQQGRVFVHTSHNLR